MSVDETRSSSSLQGNRVDHVEGSEEQGSADVQISKHSVFTSFVKGLENVVEECRSCGDIGNLLCLAVLEVVIFSAAVRCSVLRRMSRGVCRCIFNNGFTVAFSEFLKTINKP